MPSTVDLAISITDGAGDPVYGELVMRPSTTLRDPVSDVVVTPSPITVSLEGGSVTVPGVRATDDPDVTPQGWTWEITTTTTGNSVGNGVLAGETVTRWRVQVPSQTAPVQLADLIQVAPQPEVIQYPTEQDIDALRTDAQDAKADAANAVTTADNAVTTANTASADASNAVDIADGAEDFVTELSDSKGQPNGIASLDGNGVLTAAQDRVLSVDNITGDVDLSNTYADKSVESDVTQLQFRLPKAYVNTTLNIDPGSSGTFYTGAVNNIVSVSIPDPGFDYIAIVWATLFLTMETSGSQRDIPITIDSPSGALVGTASKLTLGDTRYYVVKNCGPVTPGYTLSGAHSFHLNVSAGNGGNLKLYRQSTPKTTGITALILPA